VHRQTESLLRRSANSVAERRAYVNYT
jgi:hypothetical protein